MPEHTTPEIAGGSLGTFCTATIPRCTTSSRRIPKVPDLIDVF